VWNVDEFSAMDLFGDHKCLNIKKKRHLLTIFRMQSIAENSASFNFHDFAGPK